MAYLVLRDGTVFEGEEFGNWTEELAVGEVVFHTAVSGYQQVITDLSNAGQILVFTAPHIGNCGWHDDESEADKVFLKGLVIHELSVGGGSLHADESFDGCCARMNIRGLKGVDTRALTRKLRQTGTMPGVLVRTVDEGLRYWRTLEGGQIHHTHQPHPTLQLADGREVALNQGLGGVYDPGHWVYRATVKEGYEIPGSGPLVAVLDLGVKRNLLRTLLRKGLRIKVFPAWTKAAEIIQARPAGMIISSGPGDPNTLPEIVEEVKELLPRFPILGIGIGHHLLALAAGARSIKLPHGHRGNYPVQNVRTGRVTMTSQNHGYVIDDASLSGTGWEVIYRNVNDGTVEGLEHRDYLVFSVEFYPEGAPGPEENGDILDRYLSTLKAAK